VALDLTKERGVARHLAQVRRWYETALAGQAGLELVEAEMEITETTPAH
jgi:hypothetical protein